MQGAVVMVLYITTSLDECQASSLELFGRPSFPGGGLDFRGLAYRQLEPLGPRIHRTISDGAFRHAAEPGQEPAAGVLRRDQMSLDVHSDAGNGAGVCGRVEDAGRERGA